MRLLVQVLMSLTAILGMVGVGMSIVKLVRR